MATYPAALWAPTTKVDNVDDILAAHMNDAQAEIVAIETLLGTSPVSNRIPTGNGASPITWESTLIYDGSVLFINDTTNANMTIGLTINQGANDNQILAFKSSDVAHGLTSAGLVLTQETDDYAVFGKRTAAAGGLYIGATAATGANLAFQLSVSQRDNADTTKSTAAIGMIHFFAQQHDGANAQANVVLDGNIVAFRCRSGASDVTRFILDEGGDSHQDVGTAWTNFDAWDDVALLDSLAVSVARPGDPLREQFVAHLEERRAVLEALPGKRIVTFNPDGHHFVNWSRLNMLVIGAIRQLARRIESIERKALHADN